MSASHTVRVELGEDAYDVRIGVGLLRTAGAELHEIFATSRVAVVTNQTVHPLHYPTLQSSLIASGFQPVVSVVPDGEHHKSLPTLSGIYDDLLGARLERSTPLLALGGGVVGDVGGFAAATLLRGLPFVQIPTTLLAMVDASVGGKTGINHAVGKNLIGAFHQPKLVLIDVETLRTLPRRELRSGLAECIKHVIIRDADGFRSLERNLEKALALDLPYLAELVAHNVAIKARVVAADPFEKGERAHLNFGHTFGHAIESVSGYSYTHGECVALGMSAAAFTARQLGMIGEDDRRRITLLIEQAGLPARGMTLDADRLLASMLGDKKVRGGRVRFVLPTRIGAVTVRDDVPESLVREALDSLR